MISTATQLIGGSSSRYKVKQVELPTNPAPDEVLRIMEEFHEEDWIVCGVSMAYSGRNCALWIFYRRVGLVH